MSFSDDGYRLAKSIRSIDLSNRLNSFIISWLLNQTQASQYTNNNNNKNSPSNITKSNILNTILLSTNFYKINNKNSNNQQQNSTKSTIYFVPTTHINDTQTQYTSLVEQFLKVILLNFISYVCPCYYKYAKTIKN